MVARPRPPGGTHSWRRRRDELADLPTPTADELDELADAWFWLDDPDRSMEVRREAYRRHQRSGDDPAAAAAAWRLFADHHLVGERAPAAGWLARCRRHVEAGAGPVSAGWLAVADADVAATEGDHALARRHARIAEERGRAADDPDLTAMALQARGRAEIALGNRADGLRRLDEAMVAVTNGELDDLFTGWVYCNVVSTCYAIADLGRASEWSAAALRWCETLRDGHMYPGLCRVYAAELAYLRGDWDEATAGAHRAGEELTAYDPRYAGAAFVLIGDFHRVRGELDDASAAYARAHRLGATPQPGLALIEFARGRADAAMGALRSIWREAPAAPLPHAQLLSALVDVADSIDDDDALDAATAELGEVRDATDSPLLAALAAMADGVRAHRQGDPAHAVTVLRGAATTLDQLEFPYESARCRLRLAEALDTTGDTVGAKLELHRAAADFERLGARPDVDAARTQLRTGARDDDCPLSSRELDVLRLVAAGRTDGDVADELVISHHTVARHVSNIRTKLGVASRAAATALASERGWLAAPDG